MKYLSSILSATLREGFIRSERFSEILADKVQKTAAIILGLAQVDASKQQFTL